MNYCDNCGDEIPAGTGYVYSCLPFPVASANVGESAILCSPYCRWEDT